MLTVLSFIHHRVLRSVSAPTDEQQCQGLRKNSIKKALSLTKEARLFLFMEGFERLIHRTFCLLAAFQSSACISHWSARAERKKGTVTRGG